MTLFVAGHYAHGDGYPHATCLLRGLRDRTVDLGTPMRGALYSSVSGGLTRKLSTLLRIVLANVASFVRVLRHARGGDTVFVPYPAVPLLLLLGAVPRSRRPTIVADAFVSIWDTTVVDRGRFRPDGFMSKLLRRVEAHALHAADAIVTDTTENAAYYADVFRIDPARFHACPLATDESLFAMRPYEPVPGRCRVLFVGTFVPLHGVDVIADALRRLSGETGLHFTFVGDGQDADAFAQATEGLAVEWTRAWEPPARIVERIAESDVCLGVFRQEGKSARVLPLKLYAYLACGRAIVSQPAYGTPGTGPLPIATAANAQVLAGRIRELRDDVGERSRLARASAAYFAENLSMQRALDRFLSIVARATSGTSGT